MTPFEKDLLDLLNGHRPVTGITLAEWVKRPPTTVRWWLRKMELAGVVARPYGRKGGYVVRMAVL